MLFHVHLGDDKQIIQNITHGERYLCFSTLDNMLQKYENTNIVDLIDTSYIKVDNRNIFKWLQNNMELMS